jgi:hypothetical protein
LKPDMPEIVGRTLSVISPSALICGVTDITMPTETVIWCRPSLLFAPENAALDRRERRFFLGGVTC